jgi:hypothetical protein
LPAVPIPSKHWQEALGILAAQRYPQPQFPLPMEQQPPA